MERSLTTDSTSTLPTTAGRGTLLSRLAPLAPLTRYGVFFFVLFGLAAASAVIRLDVQQLRKDTHRTSRALLEAEILNDRLRLEMEARRRGTALQKSATRLGLKPAAFERIP